MSSVPPGGRAAPPIRAAEPPAVAARRRRVGLVLLLGGLGLTIGGLFHQVYTLDLAPAVVVSPYGIGLFAAGSWLRYHPERPTLQLALQPSRQ